MKEKSELSKSSQFYLSKYRYLELKNFCLQYPTWIKAKAGLESRALKSRSIVERGDKCSDGTSVERLTEAIENFDRLIDIIQKALSACQHEIQAYVLWSVTEGLSYDNMYAQLKYPPCSRHEFYRERRKFFYILNHIRK